MATNLSATVVLGYSAEYSAFSTVSKSSTSSRDGCGSSLCLIAFPV